MTANDQQSRPVVRYRVNDYVGPAIWGFRVGAGVKLGDRVHYDDHLFNPPHRSYYIVGLSSDGKRACFWADQKCRQHPDQPTCHERFAGYIT